MAKILCESIFSYPVYQVSVSYHYTKVGTPTVFEELVMGLASDFPQLADNTLEDIANILKLDSVFLHHTLEKLVDLDVLQYIDFESFEEISLSELNLTPLGHDFHLKKRMPSKPKVKQEKYWFNPLMQNWQKKVTKTRITEDYVLDEELFAINEDLIEELSAEKLEQLTWFTSDVELTTDGIETDIGEIFWQPVKISLSVDNNLHLHLSSNDPLFEQWLAKRSHELVDENLLQPILEKASDALNEDEDTNIEFDPSTLHSLVLANQQSTFNVTDKGVIAVKFSSEQKMDAAKPCVIFDSNLQEAKITGKHLSIPFSGEIPNSNGLKQLFFHVQNRKIFVDVVGYLTVFFSHQPQALPVRIIKELQSGWIQDLPAFTKPNIDTLVFLANFISEAELLDKLPQMSIDSAQEFKARVQQIWQKTISPKQWSEKIKPLRNEKELSAFSEFFPNSPFLLTRFASSFHPQLLEDALTFAQSNAAKILQFSHLIKAKNELPELNAQAIQLKSVNATTMSKVQHWQSEYARFAEAFPDLAQNSAKLKAINSDLATWVEKISTVFHPIDNAKKIAVIDTNYLMDHGAKVSAIHAERAIILPKTVLDELDILKKRAKDACHAKDKQLAEILPKLDEAENQLTVLESKKQEIEQVKPEHKLTKSEKKNAKAQNSKLQTEIENHRALLAKHRHQISSLSAEKDMHEKMAFKVREAIRTIDELGLAKNVDTEVPEILQLVTNNEEASADDKILAVAAFYILNDILLYTNDINMKNKAKSHGITTI